LVIRIWPGPGAQRRMCAVTAFSTRSSAGITRRLLAYPRADSVRGDPLEPTGP
jgi:hypothetical protein